MRYLVTLSFIFLTIFPSCAEDDGKWHFFCPSNTARIVVPVEIDNKAIANLIFDTGGTVWLDSAFCKDNKIDLDNPVLSRTGVAWARSNTSSKFYTTPVNMRIGDYKFQSSPIQVVDWNGYMGETENTGMFNIPEKDTINVWELNFDKEYIEVHKSEDFKYPDDVFFIPMERENGIMLVDIPILVEFADGLKYKNKWRALIDTGMYWDLALLVNAPELAWLNKRKDCVWTENVNGYNRRYETKAKVWDMFEIDTLRLYSFEYTPQPKKFQYLIGINFLRHFNVYFDLKNKRLGLQRIVSNKRYVDRGARRYHFKTMKSKAGRYTVVHIADYKGNYYYESGLRCGDEILSVNGIKYGQIKHYQWSEFESKPIVTIKIKRKGRIFDLNIKVNIKEEVGD